MAKNAVILIDGQNLFHSIKEMGLTEIDIKWDALLAYIAGDHELVRTYWFRPDKIHDSFYNERVIKNYILTRTFHNKRYKDYVDRVDELSEKLRNELHSEFEKVDRWVKFCKERFEGVVYKYDQLSLAYDDIEIVKKGILKIDPFKMVYVGEKGVDVALAVKMIELSVNKSCNKIVLVSGDYDYAEAIKFSKNQMMKIHIVKFHKGIPPKNRGMSTDLSILGDRVVDIYESELRSTFSKNNPNP